jgi:hypothetical protein
MALWKILTLLGLVLNLISVILLFRYALPKRQRTDGVGINLTGDKPNQKLIALERRWDFWSGFGLWCAIVGIALQGVGV